MKNIFYCLLACLALCCGKKQQSIKPTKSTITESIYASGIIKSQNQYQVYPHVSGIIERVLVSAGDDVSKGQPIVVLYKESQQVAKQNAELSKRFSDINANQNKLKDAKNGIENALLKFINDSILFAKQKTLWSEDVGTKVELDLKELTYKNSKNNYTSLKLKYIDLKKQLEFTSEQSKKNLTALDLVEKDYVIKSEMAGKVYAISKEKGEMVNTQTSLAIIGDSKQFLLEMEVDEVDIIKIKKNQKVLISFDSYKGKVFEGLISKIEPLMNEKSKSFVVEATFVTRPDIIYPNLTFEANIIIQVKQNSLTIPREYTINDEYVLNKDGEKIKIKTGLKDYHKIEVIGGITEFDEILKPTE